MLTKLLPRIPCALGVAGATVLSVLALPGAVQPAHADKVVSYNCFRTRSSLSCVERWHNGARDNVAKPRDEQEIAAAAARERKWVERCRPVVRQDQYGVGRYHYAAPGCEFGKSED